MLVLTRKLSESIKIGNEIEITVTQLSHGKVKLGIKAPANVRILRGELSPDEADSVRPEQTAQVEPGSILVAEAAHDFGCDDSLSLENEDSPMEFSTDYAADIEDQLLLAIAAV